MEAIQFNGYNYVDICEFMNFPFPFKTNIDERSFLIDTLEGEMKASKGDYIIRGVKGEYYPCKPDVFKEIYEKV